MFEELFGAIQDGALSEVETAFHAVSSSPNFDVTALRNVDGETVLTASVKSSTDALGKVKFFYAVDLKLAQVANRVGKIGLRIAVAEKKLEIVDFFFALPEFNKLALVNDNDGDNSVDMASLIPKLDLAWEFFKKLSGHEQKTFLRKKNNYGSTFLHRLISKNFSFDSIKDFFDAADIEILENIRNRPGRTVLLEAAHYNNHELVFYLIDRSVSVFAVVSNDAVIYHFDDGRESLLIDNRRSSELFSGATILHFAKSGTLEKLLNDYPRSRDLINDDNNFFKCTPLHAAALALDDERMKVLLRFGADIGRKDSEGLTCLHLVNTFGYPRDRIICLGSSLVSMRASLLLEQDNFGMLPIHWALIKCSISDVRYLLELANHHKCLDQMLEIQARREAVMRNFRFPHMPKILNAFGFVEIIQVSEREREFVKLVDEIRRSSQADNLPPGCLPKRSLAMPIFDFEQLKVEAEKISGKRIKQKTLEFIVKVETVVGNTTDLSAAQTRELQELTDGFIQYLEPFEKKHPRSKATARKIVDGVDEQCRRALLKSTLQDLMLVSETRVDVQGGGRVLALTDLKKMKVFFDGYLPTIRLSLLRLAEENSNNQNLDEKIRRQWKLVYAMLNNDIASIESEVSNDQDNDIVLLNLPDIAEQLGGHNLGLLACLLGNPVLVEWLLNLKGGLLRGCFSEKNKLGLNGQHLAILAGHTEIALKLIPVISFDCVEIKFAENNVVACDPLHLSVLMGNQAIVSNLLDGNRSLVRNDFGSVLHLAVWAQQLVMLNYLLSHSKVNQSICDYSDSNGRKALDLAAFLGRTDAVRIFCQYVNKIALNGNAARGENENRPIHFAVMGKQIGTFLVLLEYQAWHDARNANGMTVERSIEALPADKVVQPMMINIIRAAAANTSLAEFTPANRHDKVFNLTFRGGGPKVIPFGEALKVVGHNLSRLNGSSWQELQRVGGASAGALTGLLVSLGCSPEEVSDRLKAFPFQRMFESVSGNALAGIKDEKGVHIFHALRCGLGILKASHRGNRHGLLDVMMPLLRFRGFGGGDFLREELGKILEAKGFAKDLTWRELNSKIKSSENQDRRYKHLYVVTSCVSGRYKGIVIFNSENCPKALEDCLVADTIAASMAYPGAESPQRIRKKGSGGELYYLDGEFLDGGMLMNDPLKIFDRHGILDPHDTRGKKDFPEYNRHTVALTLVSQGAEKDLAELEESIKPEKERTATVAGVLSVIVRFYLHAERYIAQVGMDEEDRAIMIPETVSTRRSLALKADGIEALAKTGTRPAEEFFARRLGENKWIGLSKPSLPASASVVSTEDEEKKEKKKKKKKEKGKELEGSENKKERDVRRPK